MPRKGKGKGKDKQPTLVAQAAAAAVSKVEITLIDPESHNNMAKYFLEEGGDTPFGVSGLENISIDQEAFVKMQLLSDISKKQVQGWLREEKITRQTYDNVIKMCELSATAQNKGYYLVAYDSDSKEVCSVPGFTAAQEKYSYGSCILPAKVFANRSKKLEEGKSLGFYEKKDVSSSLKIELTGLREGYYTKGNKEYTIYYEEKNGKAVQITKEQYDRRHKLQSQLVQLQERKKEISKKFAGSLKPAFASDSELLHIVTTPEKYQAIFNDSKHNNPVSFTQEHLAHHSYVFIDPNHIDDSDYVLETNSQSHIFLKRRRNGIYNIITEEEYDELYKEPEVEVDTDAQYEAVTQITKLALEGILRTLQEKELFPANLGSAVQGRDFSVFNVNIYRQDLTKLERPEPGSPEGHHCSIYIRKRRNEDAFSVVTKREYDRFYEIKAQEQQAISEKTKLIVVRINVENSPEEFKKLNAGESIKFSFEYEGKKHTVTITKPEDNQINEDGNIFIRLKSLDGQDYVEIDYREFVRLRLSAEGGMVGADILQYDNLKGKASKEGQSIVINAGEPDSIEVIASTVGASQEESGSALGSDDHSPSDSSSSSGLESDPDAIASHPDRPIARARRRLRTRDLGLSLYTIKEKRYQKIKNLFDDAEKDSSVSSDPRLRIEVGDNAIVLDRNGFEKIVSLGDLSSEERINLAQKINIPVEDLPPEGSESRIFVYNSQFEICDLPIQSHSQSPRSRRFQAPPSAFLPDPEVQASPAVQPATSSEIDFSNLAETNRKYDYSSTVQTFTNKDTQEEIFKIFTLPRVQLENILKNYRLDGQNGASTLELFGELTTILPSLEILAIGSILAQNSSETHFAMILRKVGEGEYNLDTTQNVKPEILEEQQKKTVGTHAYSYNPSDQERYPGIVLAPQKSSQDIEKTYEHVEYIELGSEFLNKFLHGLKKQKEVKSNLPYTLTFGESVTDINLEFSKDVLSHITKFANQQELKTVKVAAGRRQGNEKFEVLGYVQQQVEQSQDQGDREEQLKEKLRAESQPTIDKIVNGDYDESPEEGKELLDTSLAEKKYPIVDSWMNKYGSTIDPEKDFYLKDDQGEETVLYHASYELVLKEGDQGLSEEKEHKRFKTLELLTKYGAYPIYEINKETCENLGIAVSSLPEDINSFSLIDLFCFSGDVTALETILVNGISIYHFYRDERDNNKLVELLKTPNGAQIIDTLCQFGLRNKITKADLEILIRNLEIPDAVKTAIRKIFQSKERKYKHNLEGTLSSLKKAEIPETLKLRRVLFHLASSSGVYEQSEHKQVLEEIYPPSSKKKKSKKTTSQEVESLIHVYVADAIIHAIHSDNPDFIKTHQSTTGTTKLAKIQLTQGKSFLLHAISSHSADEIILYFAEKEKNQTEIKNAFLEIIVEFNKGKLSKELLIDFIKTCFINEKEYSDLTIFALQTLLSEDQEITDAVKIIVEAFYDKINLATIDISSEKRLVLSQLILNKYKVVNLAQANKISDQSKKAQSKTDQQEEEKRLRKELKDLKEANSRSKQERSVALNTVTQEKSKLEKEVKTLQSLVKSLSDKLDKQKEETQKAQKLLKEKQKKSSSKSQEQVQEQDDSLSEHTQKELDHLHAMNGELRNKLLSAQEENKKLRDKLSQQEQASSSQLRDESQPQEPPQPVQPQEEIQEQPQPLPQVSPSVQPQPQPLPQTQIQHSPEVQASHPPQAQAQSSPLTSASMPAPPLPQAHASPPLPGRGQMLIPPQGPLLQAQPVRQFPQLVPLQDAREEIQRLQQIHSQQMEDLRRQALQDARREIQRLQQIHSQQMEDLRRQALQDARREIQRLQQLHSQQMEDLRRQAGQEIAALRTQNQDLAQQKDRAKNEAQYLANQNANMASQIRILTQRNLDLQARIASLNIRQGQSLDLSRASKDLIKSILRFKDEQGRNILEIAIEANNLQAAETLLLSGFNHEDSRGPTHPIIFVINQPNLTWPQKKCFAKLLLKYRATSEFPPLENLLQDSPEGQELSSIIQRYKAEVSAFILIEKIKNLRVNSPRYQQEISYFKKEIEEILKDITDPEQKRQKLQKIKEHFGRNLLESAILLQVPEIARYLIEEHNLFLDPEPQQTEFLNEIKASAPNMQTFAATALNNELLYFCEAIDNNGFFPDETFINPEILQPKADHLIQNGASSFAINRHLLDLLIAIKTNNQAKFDQALAEINKLEPEKRKKIISQTDSQKDSALHHAVRRNQTNMILPLVYSGVDPFAKNSDGKSPYAIICDQPEGNRNHLVSDCIVLFSEMYLDPNNHEQRDYYENVYKPRSDQGPDDLTQYLQLFATFNRQDLIVANLRSIVKELQESQDEERKTNLLQSIANQEFNAIICLILMDEESISPDGTIHQIISREEKEKIILGLLDAGINLQLGFFQNAFRAILDGEDRKTKEKLVEFCGTSGSSEMKGKFIQAFKELGGPYPQMVLEITRSLIEESSREDQAENPVQSAADNSPSDMIEEDAAAAEQNIVASQQLRSFLGIGAPAQDEQKASGGGAVEDKAKATRAIKSVLRIGQETPAKARTQGPPPGLEEYAKEKRRKTGYRGAAFSEASAGFQDRLRLQSEREKELKPSGSPLRPRRSPRQVSRSDKPNWRE